MVHRMYQFFEYFFSAATFMPHGYCLLWRPDLVAMHAIADVLIAAAYFSIPLAIYVFIKRRPDVQYTGVAILFVSFIALCGSTHLVGAISLWQPYYGFEALLKLVTAAVSGVTAVMLWPMLPRLVAIPSPSTLHQMNVDLHGEIDRRVTAEEALRETNLDLEGRVEERTQALRDVNRQLDESRRELSQTSELLRMTFDAIEEGICVFDRDLRLLHWNRHYVSYAGLTDEIVKVGADARTIYLHQARNGMLGEGAPEELAERRRGFVQTKAGLEPETFILPDRRIVELRRYRTPDGGHVSTYKDMTERIRIEEALRTSQERYEYAVSGTNDGLWDWNIDTGEEYFSPVWHRILGYEPGELSGELSAWEDRVHPDDHEFVWQQVQAHLQERTDIYRTEHRLRHKLGHYIWVEAKGKAVRDADGRPRRLVGTITDITETKRLEAERQRYQQELERSNLELEQFASVASHDLQEPLRMVTGYCELLERRYRDRLDEDGIRFIDYATDGARRMQALIRDLLAYSRVGSRGAPLRNVSSQTAYDHALGNLEAAIAESGADITADPLPPVVADLNQLVQLFQNLIGNAIKYHRPGVRPEVHVAVERQDGCWAFSVIDHGIGIDARFADRIFQIFKRLHTRDQYSGTGIGLAICKRIIERHGGEIWLDTTASEGARFCFTLQASDEGAFDDEPDTVSDRDSAGRGQPRRCRDDADCLPGG